MFTGLIQKIGRLENIAPRGQELSLSIGHSPWEDLLAEGESIAVQGVCLTVTAVHAQRFACDALRQTLQLSTLGAQSPGARLNLERALRVGDRLGGHFVTGHVDGVGRVKAIRRAGSDWELHIGCAADLMAGIVAKGSIACDGVSLTVAGVAATSFSVYLVPYTWEHTTLRDVRLNAAINLEIDLLGKYARAPFSAENKRGSAVSMEVLERAGFLHSGAGSRQAK
jgi:riboflavin synthase